MSTVLVTGGAGYIGSHTVIELLGAGHEVVVVDNFSNSSPEALRRVRELAGRDFAVHEGDIADDRVLDRIFAERPVDAVIHFAALKAVGESVANPLAYYRNNVSGTIALLEAMKRHGVHRIVFSSSATVYGNNERVPLKEEEPLQPVNPYGWTKAMMEQILRDVAASDPAWSVALLRYFNPVGAHPSGRIGEDPNGIPNNLMPNITQVAVGKRKELVVFGNDYPTPDGTGVRDYIHVMDLAAGHVKALDKVLGGRIVEAYNLGTGRGYSVLELVRAFEKATGARVPYRIEARRPGDVAVSLADPSKAERELGWRATRGVLDMCADAWRWQMQNPNGYADSLGRSAM
jgi:UDP-glucose 4-epimerase